ncbi:MAG: YqaJ viral recombinase family protein [Candidatus Micrarchaeia archaeon]|jgi:putative phage-type endonuclease
MSEIKSKVIRIPYDPDDRDGWLELRRKGLGGSDAATVVGLNPFSSKLYLYADKMGLMPEKEDSEAMREGRELEDYVAGRWSEATGKKVQRVNAVLFNEKYQWGLANLDRKVVGEPALLEVKTTSAWNKTDFKNGEIPPQYYCQCQHYLAISGYERAYLAVLVLNTAFYTFVIDRDEKEIEALMSAERDFWEQHIIPKIPPAPDGSESAMAVLDNKLFIDDVALIPDTDPLFEEYERISGIIKSYEEDKDELKQQIIAKMGDKARAQAQTWSASYLPQERTTIDKDKLLRAYPQAFGDCVKTSTYRTFRAKKNKAQA